MSTYDAGDVDCLFVDEKVLGAVTRTGDQWLIPFGAPDVNRAIATVVASRLWYPEDVFGGPVPKFDRWAIAPRSAYASEAE